MVPSFHYSILECPVYLLRGTKNTPYSLARLSYTVLLSYSAICSCRNFYRRDLLILRCHFCLTLWQQKGHLCARRQSTLHKRPTTSKFIPYCYTTQEMPLFLALMLMSIVLLCRSIYCDHILGTTFSLASTAVASSFVWRDIHTWVMILALSLDLVLVSHHCIKSPPYGLSPTRTLRDYSLAHLWAFKPPP